jgi:hypothetical protein
MVSQTDRLLFSFQIKFQVPARSCNNLRHFMHPPLLPLHHSFHLPRTSSTLNELRHGYHKSRANPWTLFIISRCSRDFWMFNIVSKNARFETRVTEQASVETKVYTFIRIIRRDISIRLQIILWFFVVLFPAMNYETTQSDRQDHPIPNPHARNQQQLSPSNVSWRQCYSSSTKVFIWRQIKSYGRRHE